MPPVCYYCKITQKIVVKFFGGFMKKILLGVLIFTFSAIGANAQIMSNPSQWYINNQIYSTRVFNGAVANSMLKKGAKRGNGKTAKGTANTVNAKDYTSFKETAGSSLSKNLAGKTSGQTTREAEQLFNSFITLYKQTAAKDGFPSNDLAYAYEYFIVNNYHIYNDLMELPPELDPRLQSARDGFEKIEILNQKKLLQVSMPQERIIYNQFKATLSANPEIQKMTDAQKQEAAELLATLFGVNFAAYMKGINDRDAKLTEEARKMAGQGLEKLLGVSADKIKITNNGVEF